MTRLKCIFINKLLLPIEVKLYKTRTILFIYIVAAQGWH